LALSKLLEQFDRGVLECWSIGVLQKGLNPLVITPALHYSNLLDLFYKETPNSNLLDLFYKETPTTDYIL